MSPRSCTGIARFKSERMHGCSVAVSLGGLVDPEERPSGFSAMPVSDCLETVYGTGMYFMGFKMTRTSLMTMGLLLVALLMAPEGRAESSDAVSQFVGSVSLVGLGLTSVSALTGEGKEEGSKAQGRDFLNRYRSDKVGFRKDVLRARGPHYVWLLNRDLGISDAHESRFRCLLLKEREKLKTLFNRSEDGGIGAILDIRIYLAELAKQAQLKTAEECAIT